MVKYSEEQGNTYDMTYEERLQKVSIIGAAGKMGSGILLLTAVEMADLSLKPENKDNTFVLYAIDTSVKGLKSLVEYLRVQLRKIAEKKINQLRKIYSDRSDLVENGEIIDAYIMDVLKVVHPVTVVEAAYQSSLIFEAIVEDEEVKVKLLSQIDKHNPNKPWFFTNTSSIPIYELDKKAGLDGRIIGFHFYNPPAVQRLVEIIKARDTREELLSFANQYASTLRKVVVYSNDIAGFIGNGHFMRDILFAADEVAKLSASVPVVQAIYMINRVTQDFLIRPMGIFQLADYVGIDVCQFIMKVMNSYIPGEELHCALLEEFMKLNARGGQNPDGSQKDGIFRYEKGKITAIFDLQQQKYLPIAEIREVCDGKLGELPTSHLPWKAVVSNPEKDDLLSNYFEELNSMNHPGAELAKDYFHKTKEIGLKLVTDGVAKTNEDVNTVMLTGFYHAYGPVNEYLD